MAVLSDSLRGGLLFACFDAFLVIGGKIGSCAAIAPDASPCLHGTLLQLVPTVDGAVELSSALAIDHPQSV